MPFCCNVVSLYSAVTHAILAYGCNETYCSILELFVYCNITNFITVVQRSVCLCVFFLFFQCNTTVIYAKLEDTATFYRCNQQCFKLLVFFRSLYSEREHVLKLQQPRCVLWFVVFMFFFSPSLCSDFASHCQCLFHHTECHVIPGSQ